MVTAICMSKGMKRIGVIHTELFGRDEHSTGGAQADITAALANHTGANCRSRIVACTHRP